MLLQVDLGVSSDFVQHLREQCVGRVVSAQQLVDLRQIASQLPDVRVVWWEKYLCARPEILRGGNIETAERLTASAGQPITGRYSQHMCVRVAHAQLAPLFVCLLQVIADNVVARALRCVCKLDALGVRFVQPGAVLHRGTAIRRDLDQDVAETERLPTDARAGRPNEWQRQIRGAKPITMQNGRPATEGTCPECGTRMFKIGARK
jgi:hypothetical protein